MNGISASQKDFRDELIDTSSNNIKAKYNKILLGLNAMLLYGLEKNDLLPKTASFSHDFSCFDVAAVLLVFVASASFCHDALLTCRPNPTYGTNVN